MIILTLLVSLFWLSVTFLTPADDQNTLDHFVKEVKPGGWWPGQSHRYSGFSRSKLILLIIYPVISILPFLIIWLFKFASPFLAITLLLFWITLVYVTIHMNRRIT